jgi:hypothetical protein
VQQLDAASLRRPTPDVFTVRDVTIAGVSRKSITVEQPSRMAWSVTLPDSARIETELARQEEAWSRAGDGVLFRIGISLGGRYDELLTQVVNPFERADDRRWVPVSLDLAPYVGRDVSLIFNTGSGLAGDNRDNDRAVWGAPRLLTR